MSGPAVTQLGGEWVATCDHGSYVWEIHRRNRHLAERSLAAHHRTHTEETP